MPPVISLPRAAFLRAASLALMTLSSVFAAETVEKLALSSTEVNLVEVGTAAAPSPASYATVYSGSASDPRGREGIAWVTAKLIARQAGPDIEATVTRDVTLFTLPSRAGGEPASRALAQAMLKPLFTADTFELIRKEALAEIDAIRRDPERLAMEAFHAFVHAGHPYGHPAPGTVSSLEKLIADDAVAFHVGHYVKGNLAIAVPAGLGAPALAAIRSDFGAIPDGLAAREQEPVSYLPRPRFLVVECAAAAAAAGGTIVAGHPVNVTAAHPDYYSLRVALRAVVQPGGRLLPGPARQPVVLLSPEGSSTGGLAALLARVRQIAAGGLPADQLDAWKDAMRAEQDAAGRSSLILRLEEFLDRSPGMAARRSADLAQVTVQSVLSAASRHLHAGRMGIVAVVESADTFVPEILGSGALKQTGLDVQGAWPTRNDVTVLKETELFR